MVETSWNGDNAPDEGARNSYLEQLRMKIVSGQIGPDELLTVPTLAKAWGMSTTPVREILLELANDGLLEARRNRGFMVKRLTVTDLRQLFAIRAQLECYALSCITNMREEDRIPLMQKAQAIEQAVEDGDTLRYLETDRAYHLHLISLAGNQHLVKMIMNLRDNMRLYGIESVAGLERQQLSVPQHYQLVELLAASKTDEAMTLMRRHVLDWEPIFVEGIAALG
ncbi:GntR family transcriptional regulator [Pigmentiphaga aceris]|uniref:GntR family transcriptional regulator n=1 Tax=Pigmentiphaga aceris TaxID=1940612 RepID=A0A5C0AS06_9BURK|nr:GntR family transcriptional regulator [Pigmentiphaga aceris]QEI04972.1 GntR family transcriptional regulator [Pigmentiphaga aceris]